MSKFKTPTQNSKLKNSVKYLGVDWGEKRIGLALADSEIKVATPFKVAGSINEIVKIIKEEEIDVVVVGKPLRMSNVDLRLPNDYLKFLDLLKDKVNIPVEMIDERLSSKAADALEGNKKNKASRDAVAAMIILQGYLDKHSANTAN
jgi:putative Holliday junction resolvase